MSTTFAYGRTQTAIFASDNMRNVLKLIVRENGLNPTKLLDDWPTLERGIRMWLESGHLYEIVIEFFDPVTDALKGRWDFPIRYDGDGGDDMWVDWDHLERSLAKAAPPPAGCTYTVWLRTHAGRPDVAGFTTGSLRSTSGLVGREAGTVIATPDIMASAKYWRAA